MNEPQSPGKKQAAAMAEQEGQRMISEFFVKSLNVILGARIPEKYLESRPPLQQQQVSSSSSRSFHIQLENPPLRSNCHLSAVEPIVVDVLLVRHGETTAATSRSSLIERWVLQCVPSFPDRKPHPKNLRPEKLHHPQHQQGRVMRLLSLMLRSLYSLTRLLPAYRVFQLLNKSSRESPGGFDLAYKVRTSVLANESCSSKKLSRFSLTPVETELGRMCIVVNYSSVVHVEMAVQRRSSIFSDIFPDYVPSSDGNPHFAVSDTRLLPSTRTKSSNIPLAAVSKATGEACVRRSFSSPLRVKDDAQEQLVCPFASEYELENCERMEPICCVQGTSRDAAVGALITALRQAKPLEKHYKSLTLAQALQQLHSFNTDM